MLMLGFDRGLRGHREGPEEAKGTARTEFVDFFRTLEIPRAKKVPTRAPDIPRAGRLQDPDWSGAEEGEAARSCLSAAPVPVPLPGI